MEQHPFNNEHHRYQSSARTPAIMTIIAIAVAICVSFFASAKATPWDHSGAEQCFNRWGELASVRLNEYIAAGHEDVAKMYRYNLFGEVVSTRIAVQVEPDDYYLYENKYHWMWVHYYDNPYRWNNPLWQDAGVPHLRTFIRYCENKYDDSHWTRVTLKSAAYTVDTILSLQEFLHLPNHENKPAKKMYANPVYRGYRLSCCYEDGGDCSGMKAAAQFCRSRGFAGADDYRLKSAVGPTRYMKDSQLCTSPDCGGFAWVRCAGVKGHRMQNINWI